MRQHHGVAARSAAPADRQDLPRVAVSSGLFPAEDVEAFAEVVDADLDDARSPSRWLVGR